MDISHSHPIRCFINCKLDTIVAMLHDNLTNKSMNGQMTNLTDNFMDIETNDWQKRLEDFLSAPPQLAALCLSVFAITINLVSLMALLQVQSRITSHFLFLISLTLSDTIIGVSYNL